MRIVDASSARIWSLERNQPLVGRAANRRADLYKGSSEYIAGKYSTVTPASTGYYLEGRQNLESYTRSYVDIREFNYGHGLSIRNARMTDVAIERLIERMNLTPR